MKKIVSIMSIALLGLVINVGAAAAAGAEKASKASASSAKPTVLVVSSNSCPMCDEFEARVLNNADVKKELNRFTLKKANVNTTKVRVEVTPTVIIYDKNNKQIIKFVPTLDRNNFIQRLKKVKE